MHLVYHLMRLHHWVMGHGSFCIQAVYAGNKPGVHQEIHKILSYYLNATFAGINSSDCFLR